MEEISGTIPTTVPPALTGWYLPTGCLTPTTMTVSYTHLDVYKRQEYNPTGLYRRTFKVPASWAAKDPIFLRFEQVEEEAAAQGIIDALRMIKDNGFGIYTLDKELGTRVYTPIAAE